MQDAYILADQILQDHYPSDQSPTKPATKPAEEGLPPAVHRAVEEGRVVTLDKWLQIDQAEKDRAKEKGTKREREKFTTVEEMLAVVQ